MPGTWRRDFTFALQTEDAPPAPGASSTRRFRPRCGPSALCRGASAPFRPDVYKRQPDDVLKKVVEESCEVALAAKDVESWATSSLASRLAF